MSGYQRNPDEFVLEDVGMVHYEVMDNDHIWMGIYLKDGGIRHLNIHGRNLKVIYSDETLEP